MRSLVVAYREKVNIEIGSKTHSSLCFMIYTEYDRNYIVIMKFVTHVKKIENDQTLT